MIRLAAFDLDNTLLNDAKVIPPKNVEAVLAVLEKGVKVILCSGRGKNGMTGAANQTGVYERGEFIISDNGAVIVDTVTGEDVYKNPLSPEQVAWIVEQGKKYPESWNVQVYTSEDVWVDHRDETTPVYEEKVRVQVRTAEKMEDLYGQDIMKVVFIAKDIPALDAEKERLSGILPEGINMFKSATMLLEFVAASTSKGNAVRWVADHYGIPMEEVLCMGDNENDIAMLEVAGVSAAPASALDSVKAVVDYVAKADHNEGAAAEVLKKFVLDCEE